MKSMFCRIIPCAVALTVSAPLFTACSSTATRESTGEYVDDSVITTKVKAAFARDKQVSAMAVKVETFKGVVQLSGFVDTEVEREQASRIASGISGVLSVSNNILVKQDEAPANR